VSALAASIEREAAVDRVLESELIRASIEARGLDRHTIRINVLQELARDNVAEGEWRALALYRAGAGHAPGLRYSFRVKGTAMSFIAAALVPWILDLVGVLALTPLATIAVGLIAAASAAGVAWIVLADPASEETERILREDLETNIILPLVRDLINALAGQQFNRRVALDDTGGLADLFDDRYEVETRSA
jgi:hypothetical protein